MSWLIRYFIERPLIVNLLFVLVFIAGFMSLKLVRVDLLGEEEPGVVVVTTLLPQAGPEEVELSVTTVLEEELLKLGNLDKLVSRSMEGLSVITAKLANNLSSDDTNRLITDIQRSVDRAKGRLPAKLLQAPEVTVPSVGSIPVTELHITGQVSEALLRQTARQIEDRLRVLPGIKGINKIGFRRAEVHIYTDPAKLQQLNLSFNEIRQAIERRNTRESAGSISSFTTEKKIITLGQFDNPTQIGDTVIRSADYGNRIQLKDIASIQAAYEPWHTRSTIDGQTSIALNVIKQPFISELQTAAAVSAAVERLRPQLPNGIEVILVNDFTQVTRNFINTLTDNALLGLGLVFITLLLLMNLKQALWVSAGLPFTILASLAFMAFSALPITQYALLAYMLMLGILVDDAIVVGESIQQHQELGLAPQDAAIKGTQAIAWPVLISAVTTVLAFAPLAFVGGPEGNTIVLLPIVVFILLSLSLFETKCLLPAHLARGKPAAQRRLSGFVWLQSQYQKRLGQLLARRYLATGLMIVSFIAIAIFSLATQSVHLNSGKEFDSFNLKAEMPTGTSFERTAAAVQTLVDEARQLIPASDLRHITVQIGHHDTGTTLVTHGHNQAWAVATFYLQPEAVRASSSVQLIRQLQSKLADRKPFNRVYFETIAAGSLARAVQLEIVGRDPDKHTIADQIIDYLKHHQGTTSVWSSFHPGKEIIDLKVDHSLLAERQLSLGDINEAVSIALDGLVIGYQQTVEERVFFRLQIPHGYAGKLQALENLTIMNSSGESVFLKDLVQFELRTGESNIKHYFGKRSLTIFADIDQRTTSVSAINSDLAAFITQKNWAAQHPGLQFIHAGQLEFLQQSIGSLGVALVFCLLLILLVLIILFNSLSLPLLVLCTLPFSIAGVLLAFSLHGMLITPEVIIGIVGMIGVLVNDLLVMLYALTRKRAECGERLQPNEIIQVATQRFRPIVITSVTTAVALFPAAYGIAGSFDIITPVAMALAWGVLLGTFVSLLLFPCFYAVHEDVGSYLRGVLYRRLTKS